MSEIEDQINRILSDPEALKQVQSLGQQLGLSPNVTQSGMPLPAPEPKPAVIENSSPSDMLSSLSSLAPLMKSFGANDEVSNLLNALRPFLGEDKRQRLDQAMRLMRIVRVIPLIKDSGLFSF